MEQAFQAGVEKGYSRGQEIPAQDVVHYIQDGYVGLYGGSGKVRRLLFIYKKGDIFPTINTVDDPMDRSYYYIAMKRVRVRRLSRAEFDTVTQDPSLAHEMLRYARDISQLQFERINNLQQTQVFARLIERLLFFSRRLGIEENGKVKLDVPLSHVDIATSIGATRETVNRYMRQLEDRGILVVRRQRITINDPDKLRALLKQKDPLARPNWLLFSLATAGGILTQAA